MKNSLILFSPTGGTKKTADLLCSALGGDWETVDLCRPELGADDFAPEAGSWVLVALPSYGGRVPALAAERLKKLRGQGQACVLLCVYGNRAYEDTLVEMADLARGCGLQVAAAVAAIAEHSVARNVASGRPDAQDEAKLRQMAGQILEKLSQGSFTEPQLPGKHPEKAAGSLGMVPKATKGCINCGICARQCPAGAISKSDATQVDKSRCISCMRCVGVCPKGARKLGGLMSGVAGLGLKLMCAGRKEPELHL